jgi:hypothetical protein
MPIRLVPSILALVAILLSGPSPAVAQEVLTNESVVSMVKAGLPEGVVISKIRSTPAKFDVSADALVSLKKAGVPDKVIEAMLSGGAAAGAAPAVAARTPAAGTGALKDRDAIYQVVGDNYVELVPTGAQIESNFAFYTHKSELVLSGRKAKMRIADQQPVFLSSYAIGEAPLVRLKPGDKHDDRNLKMASGHVFASKIGIRSEDKIEVVVERDPRGLYRVTPAKALPPGEYGFVLMEARKVFDFGVD